jgi:hypothetical protein
MSSAAAVQLNVGASAHAPARLADVVDVEKSSLWTSYGGGPKPCVADTTDRSVANGDVHVAVGTEDDVDRPPALVITAVGAAGRRRGRHPASPARSYPARSRRSSRCPVKAADGEGAAGTEALPLL